MFCSSFPSRKNTHPESLMKENEKQPLQSAVIKLDINKCISRI